MNSFRFFSRPTKQSVSPKLPNDGLYTHQQGGGPRAGFCNSDNSEAGIAHPVPCDGAVVGEGTGAELALSRVWGSNLPVRPDDSPAEETSLSDNVNKGREEEKVRYFTLAWWCGTELEDGPDPGAEYARHLETIRDRLPADLLATQESVSLHDSRLRTLVVTPASGTVQLALESHDGAERFILAYRGVELFESTADPAVGLGGPYGYGDFGYDEVDVLPNGAFEHRMLFSSGIELRVVFAGFELRRERL